MSDAEDMIRAAIAVGPWPIAVVRGLLYEAGEKRWAVDKAAHTLMNRGELATMRVSYWTTTGFRNQNCESALFMSGHSRMELIRRLQASAPAPSHAHASTTLEEMMQGEGAERLAAEAYDFEVRSWTG